MNSYYSNRPQQFYIALKIFTASSGLGPFEIRIHT